MNERIADILGQMHRLELELREEIAQLPTRSEILTKARTLEDEFRQGQRALKTKLVTYVGQAQISSVLTAPVIYSMIVPLVLLDLWATLYQQLCFRAYRIPRVKRSAFVVIDRQYLPYLNLLEKLNCLYCSYGNGVISYVREIASLTEQYWCPIKHARAPLSPHHRYQGFPDYGDAQGYKSRLADLREEVRRTTSKKR
ncbi:hypothetical protein [Qipengyuania zhejiangensis]|uniref:hypothetical protein n=1 Tax=Qipengyuania zhejiangensis TaxID=3077782 RepID=UPI002D792794|nr:hypothetical protein [Qipengyuania sp. Z2]